MLAALCSWLVTWGKTLAIWIINFLVDVVNAAIVALAAVITAIAGLLPVGTGLPSMPSTPSDSLWGITIQTLNWLFPINLMISCFEFVGLSLIAYVAIAPLARWAKLLR